MDADRFEAAQRAREYFHALVVPPGAWTVVRMDGRGFSRFTERRFDKPFDDRFSDLMVTTAQAVLTELGGRHAYTESDEISVLFDPSLDLFGRGVEKLVSISAGIATAAFTHAASEPAHFDARLWVGVGVPTSSTTSPGGRPMQHDARSTAGATGPSARQVGPASRPPLHWTGRAPPTRTSCCSTTTSTSTTCPLGSVAASDCGGRPTNGPATIPYAGWRSPLPGGASRSTESFP